MNSEANAFTEADNNAAHQLLTELKTRTATQALPYQHGVEEHALKTLFENFGRTRAAIKANPGCEPFAPFLTSGNTGPKSVKSWFQSLAKNLLLPD